MTPIHKKFFTAAILLILSAQIASAALTFNFEPLEPTPTLEPTITIKKVLDPITQQEVLIETKKIPADSAKISQSEKSEDQTDTFAEGEAITAKITIQEIKNKTSNEPTNKIASALAEPIITGLNFLNSNQNSDGSFGVNSKTKFIDTSAVAQLLNQLNQEVAAVDQPLVDSLLPETNEWIGFTFPENNDYLAQKISILNQASEDTSNSLDYLASQINETDLGFGFKKKFASDVVSTAQVLKIIAETKYQDPGSDPDYTAKGALMYLLNSQNSNGGWPELKGESQSSLYVTNLVLLALYPYRNTVIVGLAGGDTIIPTKINLGFNYLKNYQYTFNGSWQDDLLWSALSYENFLLYGRLPLENQKAIDYLKNQQAADGSFASGNFFKTAKTLQTLAKPDVVVTDIQNPLSVPNPEAVIWATVRDNGYTNTEPINLSASPAAFHLFVDNQEAVLDFTGLPPNLVLEPSSEIIFQIEFSKPLFGQHSIKFKTDYSNPEFIKTNNELTRPIAFDSPQFSGPQPPTWIGAFSDASAGDITLRWQQSIDPLRHHYAIFAATASGGYAHDSPLYVFGPGNYAGITFTLESIYYNQNIYFTIVSYDANGNRGNYSLETYAQPYSNAGSYQGTLSGRTYNFITNQNLPNTEIDFFLINDWFSDGNGNYSVNFYPGFYLVSLYKSGFQIPLQFPEIKPQVASNLDFGMAPLWDGDPPSPVSNLHGTSGDGQVLIEWNPYSAPSDFRYFKVYRHTQNFSYPDSNSTLLATITNSSATSFLDETISNGINYYYAVAPEDLSGATPSVSSIGAFKGNSRPLISNLSATQDGSNVNLFYNLSDLENDLTYVAFEYWNGSSWVDVNQGSGEGALTPGPDKIGLWNAKSEIPNFNNQTKIRIKTWNNNYFFDAIYFESPFFNLDTQNPATPTINPYPAKTAIFNRAFAGTKESNSSLSVNGEEKVPIDSNTTWTFETDLATGANLFVLKSLDDQTNESSPAEVSITYDPNYFICGDLDGNEVINILDVTKLVDVAFRGGNPPTNFNRGDINADGKYDIFDVTLLINHAFRGAPAPTACLGSG
ncbi:MAG: dockerin type I domain-containing protein [Patescibacteria group bacterium]